MIQNRLVIIVLLVVGLVLVGVIMALLILGSSKKSPTASQKSPILSPTSLKLDDNTPLPESPPDKEVKTTFGSLEISYFNPVTITPLEASSNFYIKLKNTSGQAVTVTTERAEKLAQQIPPTAKIQHFFDLQGEELTIGPAEEKSLEYMITNAEAAEFDLSIPIQIKETSEKITISQKLRFPINVNAQDLPNTAAITGTLTDEQGQPIAGAEVLVNLFNPNWWYKMPQNTSDKNGQYVITVPSIDDLKAALGPRLLPWTTTDFFITATAKNYTTSFINHVKPKRGETINQNIQLKKSPTGLDYQKTGEFSSDGNYGYWWVKANRDFSQIVGVQAKHPPELKKPGHFVVIDRQGKELWRQKTTNECWGFDVSSDGKVAAGCHDGSVYVTDSAGKILWQHPPDRMIREIRFSPDGSKVFTGPVRAGQAALLDASTGKAIWVYKGQDEWLRASRFSRDGKRIVAGVSGGRLIVLDEAGNKLWEVFMGEFPLMFAVDDQYNVYAAGKSRELFSWDATGKLRWRKRVPDHVVTAGDMSADGQLIVFATVNAWVYAYDDLDNLLWRQRLPQNQKEATVTGHNAVDLTPDGQYIVAGGSDGTVTLLNRDGKILWTHTSTDRRDAKEYNHTNTGAITVTIADDAKYIAAGYGDSTIRVFESQ